MTPKEKTIKIIKESFEYHYFRNQDKCTWKYPEEKEFLLEINRAIDIALKKQAKEIFKEIKQAIKNTDLKIVFEKRLNILKQKHTREK